MGVCIGSLSSNFEKCMLVMLGHARGQNRTWHGGMYWNVVLCMYARRFVRMFEPVHAGDVGNVSQKSQQCNVRLVVL